MSSSPKLATNWAISDIPDLAGRIAIVTGGDAGVGYFVCLELARKGAKVYLACRSEVRARAAISSLGIEVPGAHLDYIHFDLTRLSSCKQAAESFMKQESRLDMLINNAAVKSTTPYTLSEDGIEVQACTAVGHFSLTNHLLPVMRKTAQGVGNSHVRIVNITSVAHKLNSEPDFGSLKRLNQRRCSSRGRYGNSMLSVLLFNKELQARLAGSGILCVAVHPGLIVDRLLHDNKRLGALVTLLLLRTRGSLSMEAKEAAYTPLYAATSLEIEEKKLGGSYLVPYGKPAKPHPNARDECGVLGRQFWTLCEALVFHPERLRAKSQLARRKAAAYLRSQDCRES